MTRVWSGNSTPIVDKKHFVRNPTQLTTPWLSLPARVPCFITLTQNVDNLSQLAGHPAGQMKELHGNLFTLSCFDKDGCGNVERENFETSLTRALDPSKDEHVAMGSIDPENRPKASPVLLAGIARKHAQILGDKYKEESPTIQDLTALKPPEQLTANPVANVRLTSGLTKADLPQCPKCETNLLRPGVVWFGEPLSVEVVEEAEAIFKEPEPIDLCLVIGTSSSVWPAAGYAEMAKKRGARVAVVNTQADDAKGIRPNRDWVFVGDAAIVLPELLKPIVGEIETWEIPKGLSK